eukprot:s182_g3.t1
MFPSKLGVLKQEYGDRPQGAMAAISKPDGSVRPLRGATRSVMVNHAIKHQDKILSPGRAEIAAIAREAIDTGEAPLCVSADICAAHRLVKIRRMLWQRLGGAWLVEWIRKAEQQKFVARDFVEFLGRLGFSAQLLTWLKPHLSPLFAWSAATAKSTVGGLPETAFGWLKEDRCRKTVGISLSSGTDSKANEALTVKKATTKWPLMAINTQLSALLARARLVLTLQWRPREENGEADDLTNERFDDFDVAKGIHVPLSDLDLSILQALVGSRAEFEAAKQKAKDGRGFKGESKRKKFDKSPG